MATSAFKPFKETRRMLEAIRVRDGYCNYEVGYTSAINQLMALGYTEYAADQFLFANR